MVIDSQVPVLPRWGLLMPVEHGYSVLTLAGINHDYPPSEEGEFLSYLGSLLSPELAREIARAKPVSDIRTHRALSNRARHYERWPRDVGGFIALGDSAVAFNASHGQGMSMAAVSANVLGDLLRAAHEDAAVKRMVGPVYQLIAEPTSLLLRPDFLARVLFAEVRRRLGRSLALPAPTELAHALDDAVPRERAGR